jgi:hypothetical protein
MFVNACVCIYYGEITVSPHGNAVKLCLTLRNNYYRNNIRSVLQVRGHKKTSHFVPFPEYY